MTTTTLPQRAAALKGRLSRLHDLAAKVDEASNLERLRQDLSRRVDRLEPARQTQALLRANAIVVAVPPSVHKAARRADGMLEKFKAEPTSATLKKGQTWKTLLDELETAATELGQGVGKAWRTSRDRVFSGDAPATLRSRLARTTENDRALEQYRKLYQELEAAYATTPADQAAIDQVRRLAKQLETASQGFDFDVPEAVKAFLEAVQSVGGASLALLTDEVIDWLKTNHSYDAYRISAKARA